MSVKKGTRIKCRDGPISIGLRVGKELDLAHASTATVTFPYYKSSVYVHPYLVLYSQLPADGAEFCSKHEAHGDGEAAEAALLVIGHFL